MIGLIKKLFGSKNEREVKRLWPLVKRINELEAYLPAADVRKLDDVRLALRRGDLKAAAKLGRVFELRPVAAE